MKKVFPADQFDIPYIWHLLPFRIAYIKSSKQPSFTFDICQLKPKKPPFSRTQARRMSSSAAAVKPPIQLFGLEGRYATALYTAATKLNQLDGVEKELTQVQSAMKQKPKLREAIVSPIINRKLLETTLKDIGKAASLSSATTNLLVLLAENGRLKKLDGVINSFKQLMSAHRGEVVCEIRTARALSDAQRKNLQGVLAVSWMMLPYDNKPKFQ